MKKGSRTRWQVFRHSCHVPSPFSENDTIHRSNQGDVHVAFRPVNCLYACWALFACNTVHIQDTLVTLANLALSMFCIFWNSGSSNEKKKKQLLTQIASVGASQCMLMLQLKSPVTIWGWPFNFCRWRFLKEVDVRNRYFFWCKLWHD